MDTPCKDCDNRKQSCHSICPEYVEWKNKLKERREYIFSLKSKEIQLNDIRFARNKRKK